MKIFIGADHRGVEFKSKIVKLLTAMGHQPVDFGAYDPGQSCDYPKVAYKVASAVAKAKNGRGMLLCMSGIGQAIAANKVKGAYAALCYNSEAAKLCREHNNANILVMGAKFIKPAQIKPIINAFLTTPFAGGRHQRRVNLTKKIERGVKL